MPRGNPYSNNGEGSHSTGTSIDPKLNDLRQTNPRLYVATMRGQGRDHELEPADHIAAASQGLWEKVKGLGQ